MKEKIKIVKEEIKFFISGDKKVAKFDPLDGIVKQHENTVFRLYTSAFID